MTKKHLNHMQLITVAQVVCIFILSIQLAKAGGFPQIVVDSTADQSIPGSTTLREAIEASNLSGPNEIIFDEVVFANPQVIALENGEIPITTSVLISGPGADLLSIDADNSSRIFNISDETIDVIEVNITGMTFTNGNTSGPGGCINSREILRIRRSVIKNCSAGANGGGVHKFIAGDLLIEKSQFLNNSSGNAGGGLFSQNGAENKIINSTFSGNIALNSGGGMAVSQTSSMLVVNSTFSANQANFGAGIFSNTNTNITNSTIVNNIGTGINLAEDNIQNSIIALNTGGDCVFDESGFNNISNFNGDGSCDLPKEVRGLISDPRLGPLTDNGSLTPTHLPLFGSPVIDSGFDEACTKSDQRGLTRPVDGDGDEVASCDIGAVEFAFELDELIFSDGFDELICNFSRADNKAAFRGC